MKSTRRGSFSVHRSEKTPGPKYSSTSGLSPRGHHERQAEFHASTQDEALLSCPQSAGTLRSESEIRGTLRFLPQLEMRPSSNAPMPTTLDNLKEAFAGESQANQKYRAFAKKAERDGFPNVARLFRTAAEAERIHAEGHLNAMEAICSTVENLQAAIN